MKKSIFILLICIMCVALFSQQVTEESVVINVEVPVRVFEKKSVCGQPDNR